MWYLIFEICSVDYEKINDFLLSKDYLLHYNLKNYNKKITHCWEGTHNDFLFYDKLCNNL